MKMFETPILLIIFNRPDTTKLVLEQIRSIRPKQLFIAADGPRAHKDGEFEICRQTRELVLESIDWDCEVKTLFREQNLGCGIAVSSAITWFFEHVEMGIILEDDVIPEMSFFHFCQELLEKYRYDNKIWHISGNNFIDVGNQASFFVSNFPFIWGWATWRRAWKGYHYELFNDSKSTIQKVVDQTLYNTQMKKHWMTIFSKLRNEHSSFTWDYQWFYTLWKHEGYAIMPARNLVKNIGFGENATHTLDPDHNLANIQAHAIEFPLRYPKKLKPNRKTELQLFYTFYEGKISPFHTVLTKIIKNILLRFIPIIKELLKDSFAWDYYEDSLTNSTISSKSKIYQPYRLANSSVDDYTYISANSRISMAEIGKFCSIGPNLICGWGMHPTNGISTSPMFYSTAKQNGTTISTYNKIEEQKKITIGHDVFIGANVTILNGVRIGSGAVIGAGAVVSKDIPPYAIAVGNPIKLLRYRFDDETIKKLLAIKWWDWPLNKLQIVEKYFFTIDEFIKKSTDNKMMKIQDFGSE